MGKEISKRTPRGGTPAIRRRDLIEAFLAGRKATTHRAYESDLRDFAAWSGQPTPQAAADWLFGLDAGQANHAVLTYRAELTDRGLTPATVARRIGTLRSMSKVARLTGFCAWSLEVEAPAVNTYRDTTGPGDDGFRDLLARARVEARTPRGRRDLALIRVLHDLGLRRAEASGLDLSDVERSEEGTPTALWIRGKGRADRERVTLPAPTAAVLKDWIDARGGDPGAVFVRRDLGSGPARANGTARLSGEMIRRIVRDLGAKAGLSKPVRPHGLRHQAITRALDLTGGDVRAVAKYSRHKNLQTLVRYDDARRDTGGEVAALVADVDQGGGRGLS